MRIVTNNELSSFKILPFDLYSDANSKILNAGEVLTPGKLIMLKNYPKIYTEDLVNNNEPKSSIKKPSEQSTLDELADFTYESLDVTNFETVINKENILKMEVQIKIKYYYKKVLDLFMQGFFKEGLIKLQTLINILISDVFKRMTKLHKGSKIRFLGEYEICHPLNVAIISGLIAKRIDNLGIELEDVLLAALLHDIGKFKIDLQEQSPLVTANENEIANHTILGYKIISEDLGLPEIIAKAALEHHENNDGSGYPQGLSSDYISELSQIINVANYYDNLTFNRTSTHISSNKDSLRSMLELGTKRFSAKMLYTFIHMFSYDDSEDFNNMTI